MNPSEHCETLVRKIKLSNLHNIMKENPFSVQITIRKKYINNQKPFENKSIVNEVNSSELEVDGF